MEIVTHVLTSPQAGLLPDNNDSQEIKTAKETRRRVARENIGINVGEGDIAAKSDMSVVPGTGADADKTTITLKPGTQATVLTQHQDISMKADSATTLAGYGITDAYTKTEVYTKNEVDREIGKLGGFRVAADDGTGKPDVPLAERSTKYIYLVKIDGATPPDLYNEWIWIEETGNNRWEQIGTTTFKLYMTEQELDEFPLVPPQVVTIGGKEYPYVIINNQMWLAENLDFQWQGLSVPTSDAELVDTPQAMHYDYDATTSTVAGTTTGLLYNAYAVYYLENNKAELLPAGWRVPTLEDWTALCTYIGEEPGRKLKSTTGWSTGAGDDDYGFNGYPSGIFNGNFVTLYTSAFYLTCSDSGVPAYPAVRVELANTNDRCDTSRVVKKMQYSVRLVKDIV